MAVHTKQLYRLFYSEKILYCHSITFTVGCPPVQARQVFSYAPAGRSYAPTGARRAPPASHRSTDLAPHHRHRIAPPASHRTIDPAPPTSQRAADLAPHHHKTPPAREASLAGGVLLKPNRHAYQCLCIDRPFYISCMQDFVSLMAAGFTEELLIKPLDRRILMRFSYRHRRILVIKRLGAQAPDVRKVAYIPGLLG